MMSNMVKEDTIELFLEGLASRKGTPGGGSAAALIGKGNRNVVSDAGVATLAAYAALRSSALNVFTNARAMTDRVFAEPQVAELEQLLLQGAWRQKHLVRW
jgi:formiminotetrahydrofolate cyclodeaminase